MLATTSRSRNISTVTVLRMAFAISRKSGHSSRARWLYQPRTLTVKEGWYAASEICRQLRFGFFFHRCFRPRLCAHGAVSLAGHRSYPRQGEIYDPYRTAHDREDHGGRHG